MTEENLDPALEPKEMAAPAVVQEAVDREAEGDKFLAEIFGADTSELTDPRGEESTQNTTEVKAEGADDNDNPAAISEVEESPEEELGSQPPERSAEETEAFDQASKSLALAGFKAEDLRDLSDERVLALAEKTRKVQAGIDKKLQTSSEELKAANQRIADLEARAQGTDASEHTGESVATDQPSKFDDAFKAFASQLDEVGVSTDALEGFRAAIEQQIANSVSEKLNDSGFVSHQREVARMAAERTRERLSITYPMLSDDDTWTSVVEEAKGMNDLAEQGAFDSFDEMLDFAAFRVLGKGVVAEHSAAVRENAARRKNNQPPKATGTTPPAAMDPDERATRIATLVQAGKYDEAEKLRAVPLAPR